MCTSRIASGSDDRSAALVKVQRRQEFTEVVRLFALALIAMSQFAVGFTTSAQDCSALIDPDDGMMDGFGCPDDDPTCLFPELQANMDLEQDADECFCNEEDMIQPFQDELEGKADCLRDIFCPDEPDPANPSQECLDATKDYLCGKIAEGTLSPQEACDLYDLVDPDFDETGCDACSLCGDDSAACAEQFKECMRNAMSLADRRACIDEFCGMRMQSNCADVLIDLLKELVDEGALTEEEACESWEAEFPGEGECPIDCSGVDGDDDGDNLDGEGDDCSGCGNNFDENGPSETDGECSNDTTSESVNLVTGHKIESATDLRVALTGGDFSITRQYTSDPDYRSGDHISSLHPVGYNWAWPVQRRLVAGADADSDGLPDTLRLVGTASQSIVYRQVATNTAEWRSGASSTVRITRRTANVLPDRSAVRVWYMQDPGKWHMTFFRNTPASDAELDFTDGVTAPLDGYIQSSFSNYSGVVRYYQYRFFPVFDAMGDIVDSVPRVRRIILNGEGSLQSTTVEPAEAVVEFDWTSEDLSVNTPAGMLRRIRVRRLDESVTPAREVVTQWAEYTYAGDLGSGEISSDVGSAGMLVQVATGQLVDDIESDDNGSPGEFFCIADPVDPTDDMGTTDPDDDISCGNYRVRYTQYRYHDGACMTCDGSTTQLVDGDVGQLKAVINPEQIEYLAQAYTQWSSVPDDIAAGGAAAAELLASDDDASLTVTDLPSGQSISLTPMDLASKVIHYDSQSVFESGGTFTSKMVVTTQYLQTDDCGCTGGSAQGVRYQYTHSGEYTYGAGSGFLASKNGKTLQIVHETYAPGTSTWSSYRTEYYDLARLGPNNVHYTVNQATVESSGGRQWVTRTEFDADSRPIKRFSAATTNSYTPWSPSSPSTAPAYAAHTDRGLITGTVYNSDNYVIRRTVQNGTGGTAYPISEYQYLTTDHTHLVSKVTRHCEQTTATPTANDVEVVEYEYAFYPDVQMGNRTSVISAMTRKVEKPLPAENGPAGGGTYDTVTLFNRRGQREWHRAEDKSLMYYAYDLPTGRRVATVSNAKPNSTISLAISGGTYDVPAFTPGDYEYAASTSGWGTNSTEQLVSTVSLDMLGRIIARRDRGGVSRYVQRLMAPDPERPGILYYAMRTLPHEIATDEYEGPLEQRWSTADGSTTRQSSFTGLTSAGNYPGDAGYASLTELSRSTVLHDHTGLTKKTRRWHDVTERWHAASAAFYEDTYEYDALGRVASVLEDLGSPATAVAVTEYEHDVLDRVIEIGEGTEAANSVVTISEVFYDSPSYTSPTQGVGNGNATFIRLYTGDSLTSGLAASMRDTKMYYDYRNRLRFTESPTAPHFAQDFDNLNRIVARAVYSDTSPLTGVSATSDAFELAGSTSYASARGSLALTSFDQRGMPYMQQIAIDPAATSLTFLESHVWRDERGRRIAGWRPNSPGTKTQYDALSRPIAAYLTDRSGDVLSGDGSFEDVAAVTNGVVTGVELTGDRVMQESSIEYLGGRDVQSMMTTRHRTHDATDTGDLSNGGNDAVTDFFVYQYDQANRQIRSINYGTNTFGAGVDHIFKSGGATPDPLAAVSAGSDPLVSEYSYDVRGLLSLTISPDEVDDTVDQTATLFAYDDLSRQILVVEAGDPSIVLGGNDRSVADTYIDHAATKTSRASDLFAAWTVNDVDHLAADASAEPPIAAGEVAEDRDRITAVVFDGLNRIRTQSAYLPGSSSPEVQTTNYVYGVTEDSVSSSENSLITTHRSLQKMVFPDDGVAKDGIADGEVLYSYNRLGELRSVTDQNGSRHAYARDVLGRIVTNDVEVFGTNVDTLVDSLAITYDSLGRLESALSKDGGTTTNAVEFEYTSLWQIQRLWQDSTGDVDNTGSVPGGDTRLVEYAYDDSAAPVGGAASPSVGINFSRLESITYPTDYGGTSPTVAIEYGTSGSIEDRVSRIQGRDLAGMADLVDYQYVGLGMISHMDWPTPAIALDRHIDRNGETSEGEYPGWDAFGRNRLHHYVDSDFGPHATISALPNQTQVFAELYRYDKDSNRIARFDARPNGDRYGINEFFEYDELDRLERRYRGALEDGETFELLAGNEPVFRASEPVEAKVFRLDTLGNWEQQWFATENAPATTGGFPSSFSFSKSESRTHSPANEIDARNYESGSPFGSLTAGSVDHDANGNRTRMLHAGLSAENKGDVFIYDAWNRLVRVQRETEETAPGGAPVKFHEPILEQEYNALHWRTVKRSQATTARDVVSAGTSFDDVWDQQREMTYTAAWQLIEERVADEIDHASETTPQIDRRIQYFWGDRYIDDILLHRIDVADGTGSFDGVYAASESFFHATDALYSSRKLIDANGKLVERTFYDEYGVAQHLPIWDLDGDGDVDTTDGDQLNDEQFSNFSQMSIGGDFYNPNVDTERQGTFTGTDFGAILGRYNAEAGTTSELAGPIMYSGLSGAMSYRADSATAAAEPDNQVGYAGYLFNKEINMYLARSRHFDPNSGRWISRDPLNYIDGMSTYNYVSESPLLLTDPFGQQSVAHPKVAANIQVLIVGGTVPVYVIAYEMALLGYSADFIAELLGISTATATSAVFAAEAAKQLAEEAERIEEAMEEAIEKAVVLLVQKIGKDAACRQFDRNYNENCKSRDGQQKGCKDLTTQGATPTRTERKCNTLDEKATRFKNCALARIGQTIAGCASKSTSARNYASEIAQNLGKAALCRAMSNECQENLKKQIAECQ